jgi:MFS family permease
MKEIAVANLVFLTFVSNLGSFLVGYDIGAVSWFITDAQDFSGNTSCDNCKYLRIVADSSLLSGFTAAASLIGAILTYFFLIGFGNKLAKRDEMMIASFLFFTGGLMESLSATADWDYPFSYTIFVIGRLIFGSGIAITLHAVPTYVSQAVPAELRGMTGAATEAMITSGILFSYAAGYLVEDQDKSWEITFRVAYCIAVVMLCLTLFLPHSPVYLVRKKIQRQEVLDSIRFISPTAGETEIQILIDEMNQERKNQKKYLKLFQDQMTLTSSSSSSSSSSPSSSSASSSSSAAAAAAAVVVVVSSTSSASASLISVWRQRLWHLLPLEAKIIFHSRSLRLCLLLAVVLEILQVMTGPGPILYYAGDIFGTICPFPNTGNCVLLLGIAKVVPPYMLLIFGDSLGRRDFLLGGSFGLCVGLLLLSVGVYSNSNITAVLGIYLAVTAYGFSFGIFLWFLLSELFPYFVRSAAVSMALSAMFLVGCMSTLFVPIIKDRIGLFFIFFIFFIFAIAAYTVIFFFLPETRAVELEHSYKQVAVMCDAAGKKLLCGWGLGSNYSHMTELTDTLFNDSDDDSDGADQDQDQDQDQDDNCPQTDLTPLIHSRIRNFSNAEARIGRDSSGMI